METLFDYLDNYQDLNFFEEPLNEVDILIINELSYFPFDNFITPSFDREVAFHLSDLSKIIDPILPKMHQQHSLIVTAERIILFKRMAQAKRYQDIKLYGLVNKTSIDIELQFAALAIDLPQQITIIAFRGTDDSIIGWKEDAYMSFQKTIPAQEMAVDYLNKFPYTDRSILLSGHSKGGNLALYAAAYVDSAIQDQIECIYSFDGPGFHLTTIQSKEYQSIRDRIIHIIPEDSFVGRMLYHSDHSLIVKSKQFGFAQHIPINWLVDENHFKWIDSSSDLSDYVYEILNKWSNQISDDELKSFIDLIFYLIDQTHIESLEEINQNKISFFRNYFAKMNELQTPEREIIDRIVRQLFHISREVLNEKRTQSFSNFQNKLNSWFTSINHLEYFTSNFPSFKQSLEESKDEESEEK